MSSDTESTGQSVDSGTSEGDRESHEKSVWLAYILWLPPGGIFGAHNYYLGRRRMAIIYSLTGGVLCLGWLIDMLRMYWLVRRVNKVNRDPNRKDDPIYADDAYLAWFPFGILGLHHFYMLRIQMGFIYLSTCGLYGFGWLADVFRIHKLSAEADKIRELNGELGWVAGAEVSAHGAFTTNDANGQNNAGLYQDPLDRLASRPSRIIYDPSRYEFQSSDPVTSTESSYNTHIRIVSSSVAPSNQNVEDYSVPSYEEFSRVSVTSPNNTSHVISSDSFAVPPPEYSSVAAVTFSETDVDSLPPPPAYDSIYKQDTTLHI